MTARIGAALLIGILAACRGDAGGEANGGATAGSTATGGSPVAAPTTGATTGTTTAAMDTAASGARLDPNTATRDALAAVPGMSPHAADALVAGRPYADMVAVERVLAEHVADSAARRQLYARIWKPIDPNTASGNEILLIPGVGPRMRHEFEEYRPWRNAAHFRREIGKYVKPDEVERLLSYTTLR